MPGPSSYARFIVLAGWAFIYAQNAGAQVVPSSPRLSQLAQLAASVLQSNISTETKSLEESFQITSVLTLQDQLTGGDRFNETVARELGNLFDLTGASCQDSSSQCLISALAAMYAVRAYPNNNKSAAQQRLTGAQSVWQQLKGRVIDSNTNANSPLADQCNSQNISLVGGLFADHNHTSISSTDVGMFISLSGYLYEATSNSAFTDAAEQAAQFAKQHLYDSDGIIIQGFSTERNQNCLSTGQGLPGSAGAMIEGLSVLANATQNATWTNFVNETVFGAINGPWNADGVLQNGGANDDLSDDVPPKELVIRGLSEASRRNPGSPMAAHIEQYIDAQVNAILSSSNAIAGFFSSDWSATSPPSNFSVAGTVSALSVLNAAAFDPTSSPDPSSGAGNPTSNPTSSSTPTPKGASRISSKNTGAIVGGTVGGAVFLALVVLVLFLFRRYRRRKAIASYPTFDRNRMVHTPMIRNSDPGDESVLVREKGVSPQPAEQSQSSRFLLSDRSRSPSLSNEARGVIPSSAEATLGYVHGQESYAV